MRVRLIILSFIIFLFLACQDPGVRKRPPGYIKIGKVSDLNVPETFLPDLRFVVRKDDRGFSVMSTLCTFDRSTLVQVPGEQGYLWKSRYSTSTYAADGRVQSGPARANLPYYELVLSQATLDSPINTLYARVGNEKSKDWRLQVPDKYLQVDSK